MNKKSVVKKWKIPLYKIYVDDEDIKIISQVVKRGNYWALGKEIEEFEHLLKKFIGCEYCVTFNSGTSALHAALLANEIQENQEVIVPSFSFIATANAPLFVNAKPIFADIEKIHLGLDPISVKQKISKYTKAIIPVHYGGLPCKINDIHDCIGNKKIKIIEDASEAIGSEVNNEKIGNISDTTTLSFAGNKILTTGEGGAVITKSRKTFEKLKLIRSHGRNDSISYFENNELSQYTTLGYNWRMSSISAALGISQIEKIKKILKMRERNASYLNKKLKKIKEISLPATPSGYKRTYQFYTIQLDKSKTRNELQKVLTSKGIFSKVYFSPIHLTKFYKLKFGKIVLPETERISNVALTLPLFPNMKKEELELITETIIEFFEK